MEDSSRVLGCEAKVGMGVEIRERLRVGGLCLYLTLFALKMGEVTNNLIFF